MVGGFSTPKHDRGMKAGDGQTVKLGAVLSIGEKWKAGENVCGINQLRAACDGKVYFTRKKNKRNKVVAYINIKPAAK